MISECSIYRTKNLIQGNVVCITDTVLGDRLLHYKQCNHIKEFLSNCTLRRHYSSNGIINIDPRDTQCLVVELEEYITNKDLTPTSIRDLVGFKNLLRMVNIDIGYNYYINYSKQFNTH